MNRKFESIHKDGALAVANYFIDKSESEDAPIKGVLKIVKLVYIAQGWALALLNKAIFAEEVEAWRYGPVIPSVYHSFKEFGSDLIEDKALVLRGDEKSLKEVSSEKKIDAKKLDAALADLRFTYPEIPKKSDEDKDVRLILDKVWEGYHNLTGASLIELTHQQGTPWKKFYKVNERGVVIEKDEIQKHFKKKLELYFGNKSKAH